MRSVHSVCRALLWSSVAVLIIAFPAAAQQGQAPKGPPPKDQVQQPAQAPIKPYKTIAVTMPQPVNDPSFEAFRKQLAAAAAKKDRAALAKLVVPQGFFWETEGGDKADKMKPGIAMLEQAIGGLSAEGWDALTQAAEDPTLEPLDGHAGVMCGPAGPTFDEKAFAELTKATGTDAGDWAFTTTPNLEARSAGQPTAPVVEKLPLMLLRVLVDQPPAGPQGNAPQQNAPMFAHVVLPSGKTAYVSMEAISPLGFDQICYAKGAGGWKIAGFESAQ
jgi:hypothetical protein